MVAGAMSLVCSLSRIGTPRRWQVTQRVSLMFDTALTFFGHVGILKRPDRPGPVVRKAAEAPSQS